MGSLQKGNHLWLWLCCFLVFVVLAKCVYDPAHQLNCTYVVTIDTSCTKDAATILPVYIRFRDGNGNRALVRPLNAKFSRRIIPISDVLGDNASLKPFQNCTVDEYQVNRVCMETPICYVYLKLIGEKDNLRVGWVQVNVTGEEHSHLSSQRYLIRRDLPYKKWYGFDYCSTGTESPPPSDDTKGRNPATKKKYCMKKGRYSLC